MYPYVLESWIGSSVLIPTYGLALALAYTAAYVESLRRALSQKIDPKLIERLFLITVVSSLAGARLFHVAIEEFSYYRENPQAMLAIWEGGFTFYGGLFVTLAAIYAYCWWKGLLYRRVLDLLAPATLLGLAIGRLGCFAAGCCWGRTTHVPWAVTYTHHQTMAGIRYVPVHPVQLYEAAGAFLIFLFLNRLFKKQRPAGTVTLVAIASYAALRFVVEFFRGDDYRGFVFGGMLSLSQFLSLALLAYCFFARKTRETVQAT